jgi:hypothetical protein
VLSAWACFMAWDMPLRYSMFSSEEIVISG